MMSVCQWGGAPCGETILLSVLVFDCAMLLLIHVFPAVG